MEKVPNISDSEWLVMRAFWRRSPLTANEIVDELAGRASWKPKTVKTLINRLVAKGALGYTRRGREYSYYPLVEEERAVRAESRSFVRRVYGGALMPMLAQLLENEKLSEDEIEELKRILDDKRR